MDAAFELLDHGLGVLRASDIAILSAAELGRRLLHLQRVIDGLTVEHARLMTEADRAGVHAGSGHGTMAAWLAANGRTSFSRAKRQQQLGDAMHASPRLERAVTSGDLTPDGASELLPTLASDHSGDIDELIDACTHATPAEVRAAGHTFQELNRPAGETDRERDARKRAKRFLRFTDTGDGMTALHGLLPSTDARTIRDSLAAIARQWVDPDDARSREQQHADAIVELCNAYNAGSVTGGREAPTVMIVIDIDGLEGSGVGYNTHGEIVPAEIVPAEIVRRMVPNANLARIISNGSEVLDLGRRARLASPAQYRAIIARDGGHCRMPGCGIPATWCQVDHVQAWTAQRGTTDLDWLILLCNYHHHMRHLPGVELHGDANDLAITLPDGRTIPMPPKRHGRPEPDRPPATPTGPPREARAA